MWFLHIFARLYQILISKKKLSSGFYCPMPSTAESKHCFTYQGSHSSDGGDGGWYLLIAGLRIQVDLDPDPTFGKKTESGSGPPRKTKDPKIPNLDPNSTKQNSPFTFSFNKKVHKGFWILTFRPDLRLFT